MLEVRRFLSSLQPEVRCWSPLPADDCRVVQVLRFDYGKLIGASQDGGLFGGDPACWNLLYAFLTEDVRGHELVVDRRVSIFVGEVCADLLTLNVGGRTLRDLMSTLGVDAFIRAARKVVPDDPLLQVVWKDGCRRAPTRTKHLR